jgi:hypothetical protein
MRRTITVLLAAAALVLAACGTSGTGGPDSGADAGDTGDVTCLDCGDVAESDPGTDPGQDSSIPDFDFGMDTSGDLGDIDEDPMVPVQEGRVVRASNGVVTLLFNLDTGTFNLGRVPGEDGIINAHAEARLTLNDAPLIIASSDPSPSTQWQYLNAPDELGDAVTIRFESLPQGKVGGIATLITLHRNTPIVTIRSLVVMPMREGVTVLDISPVVVRGEAGGTVILGDGTDQAVILDNGSDRVFDFLADLRIVGEGSGAIETPGFASNTSATICTQAGSCLTAGFLTSTRCLPLVATDYKPGVAPAVAGRKGLSLFETRCAFRPTAVLDPNRSMATDLIALDFESAGEDGLVRFGQAMAKVNARPAADPIAWWGTSLGGTSSDMNEASVVADLGILASDLGPFGLEAFVIEDGWHAADGTWTTDAARFPKHGGQDGMEWLAGQIREKGLVPGIRVAPFAVPADSPFVTAHPDWFTDFDDAGTVVLQGGGFKLLDPTIPDVRDWISALFARISSDWGFGIVVLGDAHLMTYGATYQAEGKSGVQVYRETLARIRVAVGEEVRIVQEGAFVPGLGLVDAFRPAAQVVRQWRDPLSPNDQGIKPAVLTMAHRAFMGNTATALVPPVVFFGNGGLTDSEALAYAQFAALTGGSLGIGESGTTLRDSPEWGSRIRKMIPAYPGVPRALDLFTLRFPEAWRVDVTTGPVPDYAIYGLFNWGENRIVSTETDVADEARSKTLPLPAPAQGTKWLAFDPMDESLLLDGQDALLDGPVSMTLPARSARLFVVKAAPVGLEAPIFLATNRHFAGGAVELSSLGTGPGESVVPFARAVPGHATAAFFAVPTGQEVEASCIDGTDVSQQRFAHADVDLVAVTFMPTSTTPELTVQFKD